MSKRPISAVISPSKLTPISADVFFPPASLEWKNKLESLYKRCEERASNNNNNQQRVPGIFKTFPKQDQAFEFVDRCPEVIHVFSYETGAGSGSRKFLVCSYNEFWERYSAMPPANRNHYELIREGSPCHLYFDLEYKKEYNQNSDGDKLRDIFCKHICNQLKEQYSVYVNDSHIILLDSSTDVKFSNHVVIRISGCAFTNNIHAGAFVRQAYQFFESKKESDEDIAGLFLETGKYEKTFIADMGVYTKNRNFRLFLSSKHGQNAFLKYVNKSNTEVDEKEIFFKSLICKVEFSSNLRLLTHEEVGKSPNKRVATASGPSSSTGISLARSPFQEIDEYMLTRINKGGVPGHIRSVIFFPTSKVIVYGIGNNRYCENIGRAHKSNHTLMVCDCQGGVYYQRCLDYDCRSFRGTEYPLPLELCPFRPVSIDEQTDLEKTIAEDVWLMDDEELSNVSEDTQQTGPIGE